MDAATAFYAGRDGAIRRRDKGLPPYPNDNFLLEGWGERTNPKSVVQPPEPRAKLKRAILALLTTNPHGLTVERIWYLLRPGISIQRVEEVMRKMGADGYPIMCAGWGFWTHRPEGHGVSERREMPQ